MTRLSLIAPTYNNPDELKKMLVSINNSIDIPDYEILIIDDSVTNQIKVVCDKFNETRLHYFKLKKKMFISQKRSFGVKKAKNDILVFLDSDIVLKKDTLALIIKSMQKHPEVGMMGGKIIQDGQQLHPTRSDRLILNNDIVYCEILYSAFFVTYKKVFLKAGGYDSLFENRGEGTDLSIKYWRSGFPIARNLDAVVTHPKFKAARKSAERVAEMYKSLFLIAYKYGIDPIKSVHFSEMYKEREDAYGDKCEFYSIYAVSRNIDWFASNGKRLKRSKKVIPKLYDFKPFDIFTDKNMLNDCLKSSSKRLQPFQK